MSFPRFAPISTIRDCSIRSWKRPTQGWRSRGCQLDCQPRVQVAKELNLICIRAWGSSADGANAPIAMSGEEDDILTACSAPQKMQHETGCKKVIFIRFVRANKIDMTNHGSAITHQSLSSSEIRFCTFSLKLPSSSSQISTTACSASVAG